VNPGGGYLIRVAIMLVLLKGFDGFINRLTRRYIPILKNLVISGQPETVCNGNDELHAIFRSVC
jgi:hypothetical protein